MVGVRIAALRREAGLSQAQLAEKLGISPSAMGMYEQGRREPSLQIVGELARILGVSTDYLITGTPSPEDAAAVEKMLADRLQSARERMRQRPEQPFSQEELVALFTALLVDRT